MPSFLHPALFWTLGLPTLGVVAIPVLVHLINMMRHRRVKWAAMEFLLQSQQKNRTWVMLKQLLLLLLRMAAVAAVVLLVAQPLLQKQLGNLLGGTRVHHIVLLDDSFSMSDRWRDTNAFLEAKKVIQRIGAGAARQSHPQAFTLLRFSRVGRFQRATEPDLLKEPVGSDFAEKLADLLGRLKVTQLSVGPLPALQAMAHLTGEGDGQRRIVYVVSDFRTKEWNAPADLRKELLKLDAAGAEIHLINCVDRTHPNLAITSLVPSEGIRAAGVPWFMEVAVQNFGAEAVRDVTVVLGEDGHGRPAVKLPEIPPGRVAKERFLVHFPTAGPHKITARLESDAVDDDNYRYCVADLPADVPVLVVDGDPRARDGEFLNIALAPGGAVRTGVRPTLETPRALGLKPLGEYAAVNLANIERLEMSTVAALEKYVAAGGGLAFFLGDHCDVKFFNEVLYHDGKGLFPLPLSHVAELPVDRLEPAPDLQVDQQHFIFRVFAAKRNTFLQTVAVERYVAAPKDWRPAPDSTVRVAAQLRNGAPLVVERSFGKGRVMAFLTTAAPTWNNWARNPSFVVAMQDLQAYLAQRTIDASRQVGSPLEVDLDPAVYQPHVRFSPESGEGPTTAANATLTAQGRLAVSLGGADTKGFFELQLERVDGKSETRDYAFNVDPTEGNLAALGAEQLASRLEGVKYHPDQAATFQATASELAGYNLGEAILYALVLLLLGEQILAWSASYHVRERRQVAPGGAA